MLGTGDSRLGNSKVGLATSASCSIGGCSIRSGSSGVGGGDGTGLRVSSWTSISPVTCLIRCSILEDTENVKDVVLR